VWYGDEFLKEYASGVFPENYDFGKLPAPYGLKHSCSVGRSAKRGVEPTRFAVHPKCTSQFSFLNCPHDHP
jgi:hypothetical protein